MTVVDITEQNLPEVKAFLERSPEASLFLLSNIRAFGARLGESVYSGNFKGFEIDGALCGVSCLTRGGSLLAQTDGRADLAGEIVRVSRGEGMPIRGVLASWEVSKAIWDVLLADGSVRQTVASKEIMYRLTLGEARGLQASARLEARMLAPDDYEQWASLSAAFLSEVGLPAVGNPDQRKASFVRSAGIGHWWGGFDGPTMVSIIGIIALHETIAQIGGVFTPPGLRRHGYSRAVLSRVIRDARVLHHLERIFLFTGEENIPARTLYESVGFERFGHFGMFFGEPQT